jgi:hypothetical protein
MNLLLCLQTKARHPQGRKKPFAQPMFKTELALVTRSIVPVYQANSRREYDRCYEKCYNANTTTNMQVTHLDA